MKSVKPKVSQLLAKVYELLDLGQSSRALELASQAFDMSRGLGDGPLQLSSVIAQAFCYWRMESPQQGINLLRGAEPLLDALETHSPQELDKLTSDLNHIKGLLYQELWDYDKALMCFHVNSYLKRKVGDHVGLGWTLLTIGIINSYKGYSEEAVEHIRKALTLFQSIPFSQGIGWSYYHLGLHFFRQGRLDEGEEHFSHAYALRDQILEKFWLTELLIGYANLYYVKGNAQQAIHFAEDALRLNESIENDWGMRSALVVLGHAYNAMGRWKDALACFNRIISMSPEVPVIDLLFVHTDIIGLAVSINQLELAQTYFAEIQKIPKPSHLKLVWQVDRLAEALILRASDDPKDKHKAQFFFEEIVRDQLIEVTITVRALLSLIELLLDEVQVTKNRVVMSQLRSYVHRMEELVGSDEPSLYLLQLSVLKFRLSVLELDFVAAQQSLDKALEVAHINNLNNYINELMLARNMLLKEQELWEELYPPSINDGSIQESLEPNEGQCSSKNSTLSENDIRQILDRVMSQIKNYSLMSGIGATLTGVGRSVDVVPLNPSEVGLMLWKFTSLGPEMVPQTVPPGLIPPDMLELALMSMGTIFSYVLGQGHHYHEGVFGPLPVPYKQVSLSCLLASKIVPDSQSPDERFEGKNFALMAVIFPKGVELDRFQLSTLLEEWWVTIEDLAICDQRKLTEVKEKLSVVPLKVEIKA